MPDDVRANTLKMLEAKEMEFVAAQASQMAKIKREREVLERQREEIMSKLEQNRLKSQQSQYNRNPIKRANGLKNTGNALMGGIEPSLKDKLIRDQERINMLKV